MSSLARYAWGVLVYNLGVIAWGAYVRATRSGAGCGAHWPLCNGEVIPTSPSAEMLVEYSHRLTSGLALLSVVVLFAWVWRACGKGHPARRAAAWALVFMLTEAAVGAALVLFELVADNETFARALFMAVHLANTFVLIAWIALTAWWLSGARPVRLQGRGRTVAWLSVGAVGLLLTGISGAIAALGDTLYPARSLFEAISDDLSATSHILIRLRLLHPVIAILVSAALLPGVLRGGLPAGGRARRLAVAVAALVLIQLAAGFINVLLLAPVWMQLVHLLLADLVWLAYVLLGAEVLQDERAAPVAA
ncbi:MAG TPA: COX15/CtaA family protein [Vicinamibacterales bacterium]|nr:COX15/CtaA family protein [Vicinamibacterales bacterium]